MSFDWRTTILLVLVAPLLPIGITLLQRSVERRAAIFLSLWLLAWALLVTPSIIGFAGAYQLFPWLTFAPFDTELWLGPLIYLYTLSLTRRELPKQWKLWLVPGAIQTTYYTLCFVLLGSAENKFAYNDAFHYPYVIPVESLLAVGLGIAGVYRSWQESTRYRDWLRSSHSSMRDFDLSSLRVFLATMVGLIGLFAAAESFQLLAGRFSYNTVAIIQMGVGAAVLWLAIESLTEVDRAYPKKSATPAHKVEESVSEPRVSNLSLDLLQSQIRESGWHRDSGLSIRRLARHLGTNESTLSASINAVPEMNFNGFINGLRLAEVCERLLDQSEQRTVLEVAFDAGFGSKATFNRCFREQVGMTPTQWKSRGQTSQIPDLFDFSGS
ncbi:MAG: helix-turn-helix domain-containing protein [Pseudomonadota bacterium]